MKSAWLGLALVATVAGASLASAEKEDWGQLLIGDAGVRGRVTANRDGPTANLLPLREGGFSRGDPGDMGEDWRFVDADAGYRCFANARRFERECTIHVAGETETRDDGGSQVLMGHATRRLACGEEREECERRYLCVCAAPVLGPA